MRKIIGSCNHIAQYDLREFKGRIFFVTDVHGYYGLLHEALRDVAFNSETDLLFSSGDWTDRGPDSKHVLDYLHEPWIHSTRGNHEEIFIGAVDENWTGRNTNCLLSNGGVWVASLEEDEIQAIYDMFKSLPLGIELLLPRGRKVGIVHAEVPGYDWGYFVNDIDQQELAMNGQVTAQWARSWYDRGYKEQIGGVDFVLVGHTPTDTGEVEQHGNMVFCDGGSFFRNKINLIEINDEFLRSIK
jgi:serine/threonine protein phosphatase 1